MEFISTVKLFIFLTLFRSSNGDTVKDISKRSCFTCCNCGDVGPIDPYFIKGQIARLWCHLDQDIGLTADQLYFMRGNAKFEYNSSITDGGKRLNIEFVVGEANTFTSTYYCFINTTSVSTMKLRSPVVGRQKLAVENPVKKVSNLQCRIYRPREEMKCTWDFNLDNYYINEHDIDVTLTGNNGIIHDCPKLVNKRECYWNYPGTSAVSHIPVDIGKWEVIVTVTNKRSNHSATHPLYFSSDNVTLYDPVSKPIVEINSKSCSVFSFESLPEMVQNEAKVRVLYHDRELVYMYNKTFPKSPPVCDMLPYVHYNVSIQIKVSWYPLWGQSAYIDAFNPTFPESMSLQQKIWKYVKDGDFVLQAAIKDNTTTTSSVSKGIGVGVI